MLLNSNSSIITQPNFLLCAFIEIIFTLLIKVIDFSEKGIYTYGKQRLNHKEIWYKPTAGIWQSVWLEDVNKGYIQDLFITSVYDENKIIRCKQCQW